MNYSYRHFVASDLSSNYVIFNKLVLFEHHFCIVRLCEFSKRVVIDDFVSMLDKTSEYLFEDFFPVTCRRRCQASRQHLVGN
jgi:hypothetical protein